MRLLSFISCLSLAAMAQIAIAPAHAGDGHDRPIEIHIPYNDLDLLSDGGEKALMHRIDRAVRQVCAPFDSQIVDQSARRRCRESAMRSASAQMDGVVGAASIAQTAKGPAREPAE